MTSLGTGEHGLVRALLDTEPAPSRAGRRRQLEALDPELDRRAAWLLHAVVARELPTAEEVLALCRLARRRGTAAALAWLRARRRRPTAWFRPPVELVADAAFVDVHVLVTSAIRTGVQRVAEIVLTGEAPIERIGVAWSDSARAFRRVEERGGRRRRARGASIVPVGGLYVVPEVVTDAPRALRLLALGESGVTRCVGVGNDLIPVTDAETTGPGMPGAFAKFTAAFARFDRIVTISEASAVEYRGWRRMIAAAGLEGPEVIAATLGTPAFDPSGMTEEEARAALGLGAAPVVLAVGSHEPRKNHLALLDAADALWREGLDFQLVLIGGNAWNRARFDLRLAELQAAGRPVRSLSAAPDALVAWAYRLATVSAFPSLHEGFGLPIVESLAAGTPVVTSAVGSMAEIAAGGGCLTIDPRDERALAGALRTALTEPATLERLRREARERPPRGGADFRDEFWRAALA